MEQEFRKSGLNTLRDLFRQVHIEIEKSKWPPWLVLAFVGLWLIAIRQGHLAILSWCSRTRRTSNFDTFIFKITPSQYAGVLLLKMSWHILVIASALGNPTLDKRTSPPYPGLTIPRALSVYTMPHPPPTHNIFMTEKGLEVQFNCLIKIGVETCLRLFVFSFLYGRNMTNRSRFLTYLGRNLLGTWFMLGNDSKMSTCSVSWSSSVFEYLLGHPTVYRGMAYCAID